MTNDNDPWNDPHVWGPGPYDEEYDGHHGPVPYNTDPWVFAPTPPGEPRRRAADRFIMVPYFIFEELTGNELLVYISLASHADNTGFSWPSPATIARETGLSVSTVKRALIALLRRDGFSKVARKRRNGGKSANGYYIPLRK